MPYAPSGSNRNKPNQTTEKLSLKDRQGDKAEFNVGEEHRMGVF
jgi:hypothetical protein